jgi:hypothetical protein
MARGFLTATALTATTMLTVAGCGEHGLFGEIHTVSVEVTGTGGHADEVTAVGIGVDGPQRDVALPWKVSTKSEFLPTSVKTTPAKGQTLTCRIVVDGKVVVTATSRPGAPVACSKDKLD